MIQFLRIGFENSKYSAFKTAIRGLAILVIVLGCLLTQKNPVLAQTTSSTSYYVSTIGLYSNPGTLDASTTLEGARDKIRLLSPRPTGGITVYLRGGVYERNASFVLNSQDGGTYEAPVVYRAYPGETVRLSGGTRLEPSWFSLVTQNSSVWGRLNQAAKGNLLQVDLPAHGITDFGTLTRRGFEQSNSISGLELAFNNEMMELARWPNRGQTDLINDSAPAIVSGNLSPDVTGTYDYIGDQANGYADDGYPNYRRNGLVNGIQYYLYHCTWNWGSLGKQTYWFISKHSPETDPTCFQNNDPLWYGSSDQSYPIPTLEPLNQSSGNAIIRTQPINYSANGFLRTPDGIDDTQFHFPGTRYQKWSQATDVWFQGLFGVYWADDTLGGTIDTDGIVSLNAAPSYGITTGQPFFVLNLLEELDIPGEWYLDRGTGILYFWPPTALDGSEIEVSLLEEPLLQVNDAAHVYFQDLIFEEGRADLVNVIDGVDIRFNGCTFRNTGAIGIKVNGTNNSISDCHVYNTGADGVWINGGERTNLTSGNNVVSNCEIYNFGRWDRTYHPGVSLNGVGNFAVHNEIHNAPHAAILIAGNDNYIQYNEISNVVQEANDAGAIYIGRDWGYRGNSISYNFIHNVQSVFGGSYGIYLDDAVSGIEVIGNILYDIDGLATINGGGRDNIFRNNILVNTKGEQETDMRALQLANFNFNGQKPDGWNLLGRLNVDFDSFNDYYPLIPAIDYQHGIWATQYPKLAAIPNSWNQVSNSHWLEPEGNVFSCNISWNVGTLFIEATTGGSGALSHYAEIANNLETDPLFMDEAHLDMNLQPNSPAFSLTCFQPIPFNSIGILDQVK